MSQLNFQYCILGGGSIGTSIAYKMIKNGFSNIALIDNGKTSLSATSQSGGLLRIFHESPQHQTLALSNYIQLKDLKKRNSLSQNHKPNGCLYVMSKKRFSHLKNNLHIMDQQDYPYEVISTTAEKNRFSNFNWTSQQVAIFEPEAGHLSPLTFCDDLIQQMDTQSISLLQNIEIERLCYHKNHYKIISKNVTITCPTLILAGGYRMIPLLKTIGLNLELSTRSLTLFRSLNAANTMETENFFDRESLSFAGKISDNFFITSDLKNSFFRPELNSDHFNSISGFDSYSPNRNGYLGKIPGYSDLYIATGWGGTAFKFSLGVADIIVQALTHEKNVRSTLYA